MGMLPVPVPITLRGTGRMGWREAAGHNLCISNPGVALLGQTPLKWVMTKEGLDESSLCLLPWQRGVSSSINCTCTSAPSAFPAGSCSRSPPASPLWGFAALQSHCSSWEHPKLQQRSSAVPSGCLRPAHRSLMCCHPPLALAAQQQ